MMPTPDVGLRSPIAPASAAWEVFLAEAAQMGDRPVAVVEGGYFERRDPRAEDRLIQLQDSFGLVEKLQSAVPAPRIILAVLVNDFRSGTRYCGVEFQAQEPQAADAEDSAAGIELVPDEARAIYVQHGKTLEKCDLQVFSIRATRNRAGRFIKRALKLKNSRANRVHEVVDGDVVDIYVTTDDQERYLGCRKPGTFRMSMRCTALMAQHYYDLYRCAARAVPDMTGLWIFDFDRFTEREPVRAGAEASF